MCMDIGMSALVEESQDEQAEEEEQEQEATATAARGSNDEGEVVLGRHYRERRWW